MKNICFLNTTPFWGGGEKLHLEYAQQFHKRGYNVHVVAQRESALARKSAESGLPVFPFRLRNLSFLNPQSYLRLRRYFTEHGIDTVLFSSSPDLKVGALAAAMAGVRSIVYLRGLAVPVRNTLLNRFLFRRVLTHIVANSEETKRTILANMQHCLPADNVAVIYHGIDMEELAHKPVHQLVERDGRVLLGNAGRLTAQKGQKHLVELAAMLKKKGYRFQLLLAGTGELRRELADSIAAHGVQEHVQLLDFVEDMHSFMHSIDVFLLSSLWEGFGYVLVEAMAAAKPVVAFRITSNPEIVDEGRTGFLVEYPDMEAFCQRVEQLIADEQLRIQMGECGKQRAVEKFALDDRIAELERYLLAPRHAGH